MSEYEIEPIPGLPGRLPPGETILWQGAPDWRVLARTALPHALVAAISLLLVGWAAVDRGRRIGATSSGIAMTALAGAIAVSAAPSARLGLGAHHASTR